MTTLTDEKISGKLSRCSEEACKVYEQAFPDGGADRQFWEEFDQIDGKLVPYLAKRPLTSQEIDRIFRAWLKRFRELVEQARTRAAQGGERTR